MTLLASVRIVLALAALAGGVRAQAALWQYPGVLGDGTGRSVASVGDIDQDGVWEIVAGALALSPSGLTNAGGLRALSGVNGQPLYTVNGTVANSFFGWWVGDMGDLTGDGIPDFAASYGSVYTILVLSGAGGSILVQLTGEQAIGPGDLNGDATPDVGVGYPFPGTAFCPGIGRMDAFSGQTTAPLYSVWGPPTCSGLFGARVALIGDVDGDGVADFAAGPRETGPATPYVALLSGANGSAIFSWTGSTQSGFGETLAGVGDVDADGVPDVGVGAPLSPFASEVGAFVVFSGSTGNPLWTWGGSAPFQRFGAAAGHLGDLDGDGFDDVLVSAPGTNLVGGSTPGRVFVYSGATGGALVQIVEALPPSRFGFSLDGAGDLDSDSFPDFVVGEPGYGASPLQGFVFAYSGAPAGVETYGVGCPGSGGVVPRIGTGASPTHGTSVGIHLSRTLAGTSALLLVGASDQDFAGTALPMSLAGIGLPLCQLLTSFGSPVAVTTSGQGSTGGRASVTLAIPNDPGLVGEQAFAQWFVLDPGPTPIPAAMSRGLRFTVQ